eukprot:g17972.t1
MSLFPIHVAAIEGNPDLLRLLQASGADPDALSSLQRSALELAEEANQGGSHDAAVYWLRSGVRVLNARGALELHRERPPGEAVRMNLVAVRL